jgi:hypothetical protein
MSDEHCVESGGTAQRQSAARGSSYMNDFLRELARKSADLVLLYPFQPILTLFLILARRELQQGCMRKVSV